MVGYQGARPSLTAGAEPPGGPARARRNSRSDPSALLWGTSDHRRRARGRGPPLPPLRKVSRWQGASSVAPMVGALRPRIRVVEDSRAAMIRPSARHQGDAA